RTAERLDSSASGGDTHCQVPSLHAAALQHRSQYETRPDVSREKESQHEDESIRRCNGSLGRWCYVDRTIGLG
ncbi:MAG: hypothetical protein WCB92_16815, partial [Mycobacterium sp.]